MEIKGEISTITDKDSSTTITDGDNKLGVSSSGGVFLFDVELQGILLGITKELKIMNLHLSILTDNEIKRTEVD